MPQNLTLYQIETELLDLMALRDDLASDITSVEQADSLAATDQLILEYIQREVRKVDGIAGYLRECEARAETLRAEASRLKSLADVWSRRQDRVRHITQEVMLLIGATKLSGTNSEIALRKCPPSTDVAQPDLVPPHYRRVGFELAGDLASKLLDLLSDDPDLRQALAHSQKDLGPSKALILTDLKLGSDVPGCRLVTDKIRLDVK